MRRGSVFLVLLGAFFLTLAPLSRFYVADRLVVVPLDFYQSVTLTADDASYYDRVTGKVHEGVELGANMAIRGDIRAGDGKTAVWDAMLDIHKGKDPIAMVSYRMALDRHTSELTTSHGATIDQVAVPQSGYGPIFPVANVHRKTYQIFDMMTQRTWPAVFQGTERVEGVFTYRFVQKVEPTLLATSKKLVDPQAVGLPKTHKPVKVGRYHEANITIWVDPRTGLPIKEQQQVNSTLRAANGAEGTFVKADLVTEAKDQKALAKSSNDYARQIALVRTVLPGVSLFLGLVLLALGGTVALFLPVRTRRPQAVMEPVPVGSPDEMAASQASSGRRP
ncbi:MAG: DUF3068 domain-containing protein [Streptosporangiaceae bacterium]